MTEQETLEILQSKAMEITLLESWFFATVQLSKDFFRSDKAVKLDNLLSLYRSVTKCLRQAREDILSCFDKSEKK